MNVQTPYERLWRKRLDALRAVWPAFLAGDQVALHKTRVASRRIREALPVVGASAAPAKVKKLRRKMRDLTRRLGPIRELDVELGILDKQAEDDETVSRKAVSLVRREVASERHALRDQLDKEPPVKDLKKLIKKLERVATLKNGGGHDRTGKGLKRESDRQSETASGSALATTLMKRAKRLKTALDDAGPLYAPERIHVVRIATKKLRYALEIADEAGHHDARGMLKTLKKEQDRLGYLHDLQALLKHVRAAESSPRVGARLADLTAYADSLERDCRQYHAEFVEDRDAMFDCVRQVRQTLVPALTTGHLRQARVVSAGHRVAARVAKKA
jgi:CHAD domain-containing protein